MRTLLLSLVISSTAVAASPGTRPSPARLAPATSPAPAAAVNEFAPFGLMVTPPPAPKWKRILEGGSGHIARWARLGADGKADALLTLELQAEKSAEEFAAKIAQRAGGRSAAAPAGVTVGGEKAFRVTGMKQGQMASEALVCKRGEYCYVVAGFADDPATMPRDQMEATARSIRFVPMVEPWTQTRLRGETFPIFEGKVLI